MNAWYPDAQGIEPVQSYEAGARSLYDHYSEETLELYKLYPNDSFTPYRNMMTLEVC